MSWGLEMIYLGLESGSDEVLRRVNKGETADEIVRAGLMVKQAGMKLSVTCIAGLGSTGAFRGARGQDRRGALAHEAGVYRPFDPAL